MPPAAMERAQDIEVVYLSVRGCEILSNKHGLPLEAIQETP